MYVVPTAQHQHAFVDPAPSLRSSGTPLGTSGPEATPSLLSSVPRASMERTAGAPEYQQSGLPSPYPSNYGDNQSEASSADHASAAQYAAAANQPEVRANNYPAAATPTSEYSAYPPSARSSSFPDHIQRPTYHPAAAAAPTHTGSSAGMAQQNNPSLPAPSPTFQYPAQHSPYGPPPPHSAQGGPHAVSAPNSATEMAHSGYAPHPASAGGMYAPQSRPDWGSYGQHHGITAYPPTPAHAPPQARSQVYSFVPIPGAQQHKRPRRRYEEIERMYKCGWQGCEKAYGTLNHLNAHVTMQSHGLKRTPEEFKEIRREWKARRKEEEAQRKADEDRQRQAAASAAATAQNGQGPDGAPAGGPGESGPGTQYPPPRTVQLPPIGYQPNQYPTPSSAGAPPANLTDYPPASSHMYSGTGYQQPPSPYGAPPSGGQMYNQRR